MSSPSTTQPLRLMRVLLAGAAFALLASCGAAAPVETPAAPAAVEAAATAVPSPTAVATPRVIETAQPSAESASQLGAVEQAVRRIRGRGVEGNVERTFVTSAGMRAIVDEELEDPEVLDQLRQEGLLLEALGLVPAGTDLVEAYRKLLGSQVLGLYDPTKKAFYVLANAQLGPLELSTYAHEYQHALQDERFDLDKIDHATRANRDAATAASALIEGDATLLQSQYVAQELGRAGALALLAAAGGVPPSGPPVLLDLLQFPYLQGAAFVQAIAQTGGNGAIDAAFGRLPASTEQILHPEKYTSRDAPLEVRLEAPLPNGWTPLGENVMGEFLLRRWVQQLGTPRDTAFGAAAGWGGDRYVVARGPAGQLALVARITWDSPADASEFVALFPSDAPGIGARPIGGLTAVVTPVDARTVAFAVAPTRAASEELARAALGR